MDRGDQQNMTETDSGFSSSAVQAAAAPPQRGPNAWWVGFVGGMATFVDLAATVGVGIALVLFQSPGAGQPGLSGNEIGVLTAALTAGVASGSLLGGRMGDLFGRRKVFMLTLALVVLGAMTPFIGASFGGLLFGVTLIGLGVGADLPVALATIAEAAHDGNRGKILVFSNMLGGFGIAMSVGLGILFGAQGPAGGDVIFGAFGSVALVVLLLRLTIPESASWLKAREERRAGVHTVRADVARLRDFWRPTYRRPFLTLLGYYTLASMSISVISAFGTYAAVNVAHIPVNEYQKVSMVALPLAVVGQLWFMAVADTRWRMPHYAVGAIAMVAANLIPAVFGFSMVTLIASLWLGTFAGAFCFDTMMKVWTQESFPTMLRSTAQGTVYGVARFATAGLNAVTPALLAFDPQGLYVGAAALGALGYLVGWLGFRRHARNIFDAETELLGHRAPAP
jgi:inositol transporter-like SP family MFS transporter